MFSLGPMEIAFFLGIVLLLFGPDKIPQIAKSVGKATREYQKALNDVTSQGDTLMNEMKGNNSYGGVQSDSSSSPSSGGNETVNKQLSREQAIMQQAQMLGINTNGKTIDQIVDEILSRN